MDYVSPDECGRVTLHDYIIHDEEIGQRLLYAWAMQFCYGMEFANARGLVAHRDIKPLNDDG